MNNNKDLISKRKYNNKENNNYFEMKMKQENREENSKNNDIINDIDFNVLDQFSPPCSRAI